MVLPNIVSDYTRSVCGGPAFEASSKRTSGKAAPRDSLRNVCLPARCFPGLSASPGNGSCGSDYLRLSGQPTASPPQGGPRTRKVASSKGRPSPPLVLFLCRANTAASIMAEAILRHLAQGRVQAASAGEIPYGQVNRHALECLYSHGVATQGLRSRMWGEFFGLNKPPVRFLIALSDVYAAESNWGPNTIIARWDMPDPADVAGAAADIWLEFEEAYKLLESRIRKFLALTSRRLTDRALSRELALIGEQPERAKPGAPRTASRM